MVVSVFDLFSIGPGPSSSHTVGPMRAAFAFVAGVRDAGLLERVVRVRVELLGSLGATGRGHGSDRAVVAGLAGERPESCDPAVLTTLPAEARASGTLTLFGGRSIAFDPDRDVTFDGRRVLPFHPNAVVFDALDGDGRSVSTEAWYSVGGGFVVRDGDDAAERELDVPYPFRTAEDLLASCAARGTSIAALALANECVARSEADVRSGLLEIWAAMQASIDRGMTTDGVLPGGFGVRRRAPVLARHLESVADETDPLAGTDWLTLVAMAVNEENAAGGRIVTAPTNGAAGVIPAVLSYAMRYLPGAGDDRVVEFLLTAGAIGSIYKRTASISGAEVGCQGEVGSACSMAAGAFAAVLGGSPAQVENAAEIGIEHHLGMTCDPVGGLVQIPCIERNGIAAVKAVTAARTAVRGDGTHVVSLDAAIRTMRQTGRDMKSKYKETSRGGLAVNVVEC